MSNITEFHLADNVANITLKRVDKVLSELAEHREVMQALARTMTRMQDDVAIMRQTNTTIAQLFPMLAERNDRTDTRVDALERRIAALESQQHH
jgi:polyhydroxyalkanoate synthesis regulator phasin